jgi:hypothetical protein
MSIGIFEPFITREGTPVVRQSDVSIPPKWDPGGGGAVTGQPFLAQVARMTGVVANIRNKTSFFRSLLKLKQIRKMFL